MSIYLSKNFNVEFAKKLGEAKKRGDYPAIFEITESLCDLAKRGLPLLFPLVVAAEYLSENTLYITKSLDAFSCATLYAGKNESMKQRAINGAIKIIDLYSEENATMISLLPLPQDIRSAYAARVWFDSANTESREKINITNPNNPKVIKALPKSPENAQTLEKIAKRQLMAKMLLTFHP